LAGNPHLELKRLPRYSPKLNPSERFGKALRRRATHNRLVETLTDLKQSMRNSRRYVQTRRERVKSLVNKPPKAKRIRQS
jgi:transposase